MDKALSIALAGSFIFLALTFHMRQQQSENKGRVPEPKFSYGQRVRITKGFYRNLECTGLVTEYSPSGQEYFVDDLRCTEEIVISGATFPQDELEGVKP